MADVIDNMTLTGAVFTDGTTLSGSWTVEYNSTGAVVAVSNVKLTVSGPGGTTTFTSGYMTSASPSPGDDVYQMLLSTGNNSDYSSLYLDWAGESPTLLYSGTNQGVYTSIVEGSKAPMGLRLATGSTAAKDGMIADANCFVSGTLIDTPKGNVAVETMKIGDSVSLVEGGAAPIRWIGRKAVAGLFADPLRDLPVRIRAGALADHLPVRDLLVSPCHAFLIDNMLVQAGALVNGLSITHEIGMTEHFTYFHIELADHSLIFAEGVAAETFIDNADRLGFDNWAEHEALYGDERLVEMDYPRVKAARQLPTSVSNRLKARAVAAFSKPVAMAA